MDQGEAGINKKRDWEAKKRRDYERRRAQRWGGQEARVREKSSI